MWSNVTWEQVTRVRVAPDCWFNGHAAHLFNLLPHIVSAGANTQSASSQKTSTESMNVFRCVGIPSAAGDWYLVLPCSLSFVTNQMCLSCVGETFPQISSWMRQRSAENFCGGHGSKVKLTAPWGEYIPCLWMYFFWNAFSARGHVCVCVCFWWGGGRDECDAF